MIWKTNEQSLSPLIESDARVEALTSVFTSTDSAQQPPESNVSDEILTPKLVLKPVVSAFHTSPLPPSPPETGIVPNHPDLGGDPVLQDATSIIIML
jgi:hypothetical protein